MRARELHAPKRHRHAGAVVIAVVVASLVACTVTTPQAEPARTASRVRFEPAGPGDVATLVRAFVARVRAEGRTPLVYVGATWCEPCGYFHAAATRGDLDRELPAVTLLEFDLDVDAARLAASGYSSRMIPLFVVPGDDGRASDRRIEGSIHGTGSPAQIAPRLRAILSPL